MATQTSVTAIKKLPPIKEDVGELKLRISILEKEVISYKGRLEDLRKAKNNLIIKSTKEYVNLAPPQPPPLQGAAREKRTDSVVDPENKVNSQYSSELERVIENLTKELNESQDLVHALRIENEELKTHMDKIKRDYNVELSGSLQKNEDYKREIHKWEEMYKEWMSMMETRVANINRTHQILQQVITKPPEDTNQ